MKTMGKLIFKGATAVAVLLLISFIPLTGAQLEKTFTWKYPVSKDTRVDFDNYNCDIVIHVWDKSEVEYHLTIGVTGKTTDDETRLLKYLENYNFTHSGATVNFHNTFWKNRKSINGKTTLEIGGEKDIELTDFNMKGEIWIPAGNPLYLDSKYSRIDMDAFKGKLSLSLYNDNLYGASVSEGADITAKYANIEFTDMKDIKADLYNCDFNAGNTGAVDVVSKYSKFSAKNTANLVIDSYNDKFTFEKTGEVKFTSKYSDLKTANSEKISIDCYNGSIMVTSSKAINLSSKYADIHLDNAGDLRVISSYNDKFQIGTISSIKIDESKYSIYRTDELSSSLNESDGYNDSFSITRTGNGFKEIKINGKYSEISVGIPASLPIRLKANIKYATLHINESAFTTRIKILESSELQYEGFKGAEKEDMPMVEIKGYNMTLKIEDIH
jgi:hypothetical protein